jgi:hydrogenase maturation protease
MTLGTVVIGVGHPYRSDDAVGLAVLGLLADRNPSGLTLIASTGEPTELIEAWDSADMAIIIDALHHPYAEPGRVHHFVVDLAALDEQELPSAASSHGIELGQALALADALDRLPNQLILYAIEVRDVGFGDGLTPPVETAARTVATEISESWQV